MLVQLQTRFCLLCVLTFLFPQSHRCHEPHTPKHHHGHHHDPHHNASQPHGGDALEEEQQFYIAQLFRHYGTSERLDFDGFQSLLLSLGLGSVKLVEVEHEELGHDHVAHLDLLDVQDGLHSHSDGHKHGHGHGHQGHHHAHEPAAAHTTQAPTKCTTTTTAPTPPRGTQPDRGGVTHKPPHEHSHHGHKHHHGHHHHHGDHHHHHGDHDHHSAKMHDKEPLQNGGQTLTENGGNLQKDTKLQPHNDPEHDHNEHSSGHGEAGEEQHETLAPATSKSPNLHHHDDDAERRAHSTTAPPPGVEEQLSPATTGGATRKRKGKGLKGRGKGQTGEREDGERERGGGRSKREAPGGLSTPTAPALIGPAHPGGSNHQHEECLNLTQLLTHFGLSPDSLISPMQFSYLCPALLYQIDRRLCLRHYHNLEVESQALEPPNSVMVWVSGFVSITIISLLSLLGVVLVPILNQGCFKFLLTFLVALAVGTLSGDALLHLLPHSQGQHDHSADQKSVSDMSTEFDGVWKGLMALGGIYLLFIIEHCLGMYKHYKDHKSSEGGADEGAIGRKLSDHKLNRRSDAEWLHLKALPEDADSSAACDNGLSDTQLTEVQTPDSPSTRISPQTSPPPAHSPKKNGHKAHGHSHGHSHGGHCHSDQDMKDAGIASIAWMVIMGDGMHNFSDGLAIGAAFSANVTGGISTSVAVFCHELPHELGDFAVLLKAGMSVKQAIVYNVLSALMAYVGMVIGTAVGQYTHNVTSWIFAITAGMFLYVALVDMLPEMLHGDSEDHKRCQVGHFLLQNLGLLSGFSIMLLIAIFEDKIVVNFDF